jgi:hypothetical protein
VWLADEPERDHTGYIQVEERAKPQRDRTAHLRENRRQAVSRFQAGDLERGAGDGQCVADDKPAAGKGEAAPVRTACVLWCDR